MICFVLYVIFLYSKDWVEMNMNVIDAAIKWEKDCKCYGLRRETFDKMCEGIRAYPHR